MKPVVLLVGRLPGVVGNVAKALEDMPIRWLGAHDRAEVIQQLDTEPGIACVVMGAGLDDTVRGDLVGVIAARRPDSGPRRSAATPRSSATSPGSAPASRIST